MLGIKGLGGPLWIRRVLVRAQEGQLETPSAIRAAFSFWGAGSREQGVGSGEVRRGPASSVRSSLRTDARSLQGPAAEPRLQPRILTPDAVRNPGGVFSSWSHVPSRLSLVLVDLRRASPVLGPLGRWRALRVEPRRGNLRRRPMTGQSLFVRGAGSRAQGMAALVCPSVPLPLFNDSPAPPAPLARCPAAAPAAGRDRCGARGRGGRR